MNIPHMKKCFLVDFDGTICTSDLGDVLAFEGSGRWWHDNVKGMGHYDPLSVSQMKENYAIWNDVKLTHQQFLDCIHRHAQPRKGFTQWYERCLLDSHDVYVISGGLESYVRYWVSDWTNGKLPDDQIIAVPCMRDGPYAYVRPDIDKMIKQPAKSGHAKRLIAAEIQRKHPASTTVLIGDGRSDIAMVELADDIYARRYLAEHLKKNKKPHKSFSTFEEIPPLF